MVVHDHEDQSSDEDPDVHDTTLMTLVVVVVVVDNPMEITKTPTTVSEIPMNFLPQVRVSRLQADSSD